MTLASKIAIGITCFIFILFSTSQRLNAQGGDQLLGTLGAASAVMVYNTYICIGSYADAYVGGCSDEMLIQDLMKEQHDMLAKLIKEYQKLLDSGEITDENDKDFVRHLIILSGKLSTEANALSSYVVNPYQHGTK